MSLPFRNSAAFGKRIEFYVVGLIMDGGACRGVTAINLRTGALDALGWITEAAAREGVASFHEAGCDGIIAVGGGSSIDLAKAVAVSARHPGPLCQFALIEGGLARITAATVPVVAIPTTAGTGSEVGRGAIIILDDGRMAAIELKRPDGRGRLSEAQIAWREMAETLPMGGYAVCKNVPEVFKQLRAWQFPGAERVITF